MVHTQRKLYCWWDLPKARNLESGTGNPESEHENPGCRILKELMFGRKNFDEGQSHLGNTNNKLQKLVLITLDKKFIENYKVCEVKFTKLSLTFATIKEETT